MPAILPKVNRVIREKLSLLGEQLRSHRKHLKISAVATAEAAGVSRVTLHRIEKGEPSVSMAAYLSVIDALGMGVSLHLQHEDEQQQGHRGGWIPARITVSEYPQLKQLAWQLSGDTELSPAEALALYERNERHIDFSTMQPEEQELLQALRTAFEKGQGLV